MAELTAYEVTGALTQSTHRGRGPWEYDGKLYLVALDSPGEFPAPFGVFESEDGGQTWAPLGPRRESAVQELGVCAHYEFPATPWLYVAYPAASSLEIGGALDVVVSRFDLAAGTWSDSSPLEFAPDTGSIGGVLVEMSDDEKVWAVERGGSGAQIQHSYLSPSLTWARAFEPIAGAGSNYDPAALLRGTDGRMHLHVKVYGGDVVLADEADGGLETVYSAELVVSQAASAYDAEGNLALLADDGALQLRLGESGSSIYTDASVGASGYSLAAVLARGEGAFDVYWFEFASAALWRRRWDGLTWTGAAQELGTFDIGAGPAIGLGAMSIGGPGLAFGINIEESGVYDLWFWPISAAALLITGLVGIPSGEAFGTTHGLVGGGEPESCGDPSAPPADGCGPTSEPPGDDEPTNGCPTYGYSF